MKIKLLLLYIHGLGSNRESRKFSDIKDYFGDRFNYDFIEWNNESNVADLIRQKAQELIGLNGIILIGDSTGANFAYQLRELRDCPNDSLILTSPLLDIDKRIADFEFPSHLVHQLIKIDSPSRALIIATKTDEVLDMKSLFETNYNRVELVALDDSHRLLSFKELALPIIDDYIKKQHLSTPIKY